MTISAAQKRKLNKISKHYIGSKMKVKTNERNVFVVIYSDSQRQWIENESDERGTQEQAADAFQFKIQYLTIPYMVN